VNFKDFNSNFPAIFREAFCDVDMAQLARDLDELDHKDGLYHIGYLVLENLKAALESIEDDLTPGGEYAEEKRLDDRDRARECNREIDK
jgi:hypothetical protein